MLSIANYEIKMSFSFESPKKKKPPNTEKIFLNGISSDSDETLKICEKIHHIKNLQQAVALVEKNQIISKKIIQKLLEKKGDVNDLMSIFKRALSLSKNENSIVYYVSLVKNAISKNMFKLAEELLIKAEDEREIDAYFYVKFINFARQKNALDFCEMAFLRFKKYFDIEQYGPDCDFSDLSKDIRLVYETYGNLLIKSKQHPKLSLFCRELEENWRQPPHWLNQVKQTLDAILQENFKKGKDFQREERHDQAIEYFRNAAYEGVREAMYELAMHSAEGLGVPKDVSVAIAWLQCAADAEFAPAQYALGIHYQKGIGVEKDQQAAFNYYKKAAEGNNMKGMLALARCYICECGTKMDLIKARELVFKAGKDLKCSQSKLYAEIYGLLKHAENGQNKEIDLKRKASSDLIDRAQKKPRVDRQKMMQDTIQPSLIVARQMEITPVFDEGELHLNKIVEEDFELDLNKNLEENEAALNILEMFYQTS